MQALNYPQVILCADEAIQFIAALSADELLFHFDESAFDCLADRGLTWSRLQYIEDCTRELFHIDWLHCEYANPFDVALCFMATPDRAIQYLPKEVSRHE